MKAYHATTTGDVRRWKEMAQGGHSISQIARIDGRAYGTVARYVGPIGKMPVANPEEVRALRADGMPYCEIGFRCGISAARAHQIVMGRKDRRRAGASA